MADCAALIWGVSGLDHVRYRRFADSDRTSPKVRKGHKPTWVTSRQTTLWVNLPGLLGRHIMAKWGFPVVALLTLAFVQYLVPSAHAAEIRVLAGGAMNAIWTEIKPKFEQASGHKLDIFFGTTPNLIKEATSGKPFDVGIVPVEVMQDAAARARFVSGPTIDIARVGLGVAIRAGGSKPDISTSDALKATLLKADSVASIPQSATGYSIAKVFDQLGITESMKAKMKPQPTPAQVVEVVATGKAELALFLMNVLMAPGLDLVGPFPAEVQQDVVFTGALGMETKEVAAARALLDYLKTQDAEAVIKGKGMHPG